MRSGISHVMLTNTVERKSRGRATHRVKILLSLETISETKTSLRNFWLFYWMDVVTERHLMIPFITLVFPETSGRSCKGMLNIVCHFFVILSVPTSSHKNLCFSTHKIDKGFKVMHDQDHCRFS